MLGVCAIGLKNYAKVGYLNSDLIGMMVLSRLKLIFGTPRFRVKRAAADFDFETLKPHLLHHSFTLFRFS